MARATVSGIVFRAPEKRFTSNNIPITSFAINISDKDEMLLRVTVKGNAADTAANNIDKGDNVVVEGRLQIVTAKQDNGTERKIMEIDASSFEKITAGTASATAKTNNDKIVEFATEEFTDELIGEDEIPF